MFGKSHLKRHLSSQNAPSGFAEQPFLLTSYLIALSYFRFKL